mmetsp:Transcript_10893/g.19408  ORF Transcript_10893/g.19408 Transcript_10893/m.19408 type:complete len:92 (+) Transcript_10893:1469-1744(+)
MASKILVSSPQYTFECLKYLRGVMPPVPGKCCKVDEHTEQMCNEFCHVRRQCAAGYCNGDNKRHDGSKCRAAQQREVSQGYGKSLPCQPEE